MQKGGKGGLAFVVGKGAESSIITRCLLPENDDDAMPLLDQPAVLPVQMLLKILNQP